MAGPPAPSATVLARVLEKKGGNMGTGGACCGCAAVGNHLRIEGEDRALSHRSVHVFCLNNFAQLVVALLSFDESTLIVNNSISTLLLWECSSWESGGNRRE